MSTSLAIIQEKGAITKRRHRCAAQIDAPDAWLGTLHAEWEQRRVGRFLPKRSAFDPLRMMQFSRGRVHIVETLPSEPQNYRFRLWGHMIDFDHGADFTERRLDDMPHSAMRLAALADYADAVASGTASYQLIYNAEKGWEQTYARLILPVTADGRSVTHLFVAINQRPIPEFAAEARHPYLRLIGRD